MPDQSEIQSGLLSPVVQMQAWQTHCLLLQVGVEHIITQVNEM